jgi:hypothetical protein
MSLTKRVCLFAGAALSLSSVALAQSTTLDQSRSYGRDLLSDAAGRTNSLVQDGPGFTVNTHGYIQARYNLNQRDDDGLDANDNDLTNGFQLARTVLNFSGNIANENWGYFIQVASSDAFSGGDVTLQDAYGTYRGGNGWRWTFGQFKLPLFREEYVGDQYQLFADRSVLNSVFTQARSQGIMVDFESDQMQFLAGFSDGIATANTDFTSMAEADYAFTARLNWKWAGAWAQARDFTSFQGSDFFGMVGVAGHYQDGGETVGTSDIRRYDLTADVSVEGNGWNVFAAAMWNNTEPDVGDDLNTYGFIVQGGVFLAPQWEIIAGFDMLLPDDDAGANDDEFSTIRVGFNYYVVPESHAVKATVDFSYFLDDPSASIAPANTLTGLLPSGEDGQWNLRGQIQFLF